jgi:hypothetical protein
MSEITSGLLAAELTKINMDEAFEVVRSNIAGVLPLARMVAPITAYGGYKTSWLEERVDATGSALTAALTDVATTVPVADGGKFRVGMLISAKSSDEVMLVKAISGNNLTVTRGFGGTTATALADETVIFVDSVGREENSLAETDGIFQPFQVENFFQTMDTAIGMSRRALATLQFGDTNDLQYQLGRRLEQLAIQMNRALVKGRKGTDIIDSKEHTFTGGIKYFLDQADTVKTDASGAALTLATLDNVNAEIVERGGRTDTLVVSIAKARLINDLVSAKYSSQRLADFLSDKGAVRRLPSDLPLVGNVNNIVIDTNLSDTEVLMLDSSKIEIAPMAQGNANASGAWRTVDATQNGQDGQVARIIGDFAFRIRESQTHMARVHGLA